ncbi:hypothetical protein F4782DRAFT_509954 [Xylaria castorea]|nr:hypothetical protein F4782DRAFT_509954 [Xylaria castorea]
MKTSLALFASAWLLPQIVHGSIELGIGYGTSGYYEDFGNDGECKNINSEALGHVVDVDIDGGNCVFWQNKNCNGHHTDRVYDGVARYFNDICDGKLENKISSWKCCTGSTWCAGDLPSCAT